MQTNRLIVSADDHVNLLPADGEAYLFRDFLAAPQAGRYLHQLIHHVAWRHDEVILFGKRHILHRKAAWYADEGYAYTYSKITKHPLPWNADLLALKSLAETCCGVAFNSCLLNYYHTGREGMGWHSDNEKTLVRHGSIASISLGAERKFLFRHRQAKTKVSLLLPSSSLLLMKGETQTKWVHALPKMKKILEPRVNLTFRMMA